MRSIPMSLVAGALAAPLVIAAAPASHGAEHAAPAPSGKGAAFAISGSGLVPIPGTPSVASAGRYPKRESKAELPPNPVVSARALTAAAWAGRGHAEVAGLAVVPARLAAEAVTATCVGGRGAAHLAQAVLAGERLAATPAPNSAVTVPLGRLGKASVTLNKQVRHPGGGLTVTAIEIVVPVVGKTQKLSIASATCLPAGPHQQPKPKPDPSHSMNPYDPKPTGAPQKPRTPAPQAPAPRPVPRDLDVTG
ncbi:choice-of-anchor P family protein [Thermomonospora umbrina]|uniref:Dehydratase n=1 Tax=Thermomonospora umbrina TaxID=111806 RepID=A0A3D9SPN1_9ACTN|nr:choice-of-anchor P family protein [Thermomonospora umbrina]REE97922.1 hypothetical protein DFJ69_3402 [Thermomonospora umbrina]